MNSRVTRTNGILQLDCNFASTTVSHADILIDQQLPRQVLKLAKWRIQFDNTTSPLSYGRIWLDLPWTNPSSITNNTKSSRLMLLLDSDQVTVRDPHVEIETISEVPQSFTLRILDSTGAEVQGLKNAQFVFTYDWIGG